MFYVYWFVPGMLFSAFFASTSANALGHTLATGPRIAMVDGVYYWRAAFAVFVMYGLSLLSALAMVLRRIG
jgi:hypothetical protein